MKIACTLCGLLLAVAIANASPIVKRETNEINPLNEDDADTVADDDRSDREKRKIGIVKLGVTNGIINFVFGKLDSFLDAKTRAIAVLDQGNKAKNIAFGIDNTQSATGQFISNLIGQKIQAGTASIGPVINSATTFFSGASSGIANAFAAKLGPLSSLSGGSASGGVLASKPSLLGSLSGGAQTGGGSGGAGAGLGGILSSLSSLSGGLSGGLGGGLGGGSSGESSESSASASAGAGAGLGLNTGASAGGGINLGAFANLGGGGNTISDVSTTTEDIPEFDRTRVSLDIPPPVFGGGFNLITDISKVVSSVILNSAHRTQSLLEVMKPFFRGIFAIKGLPSDNPQQ